MRRSLLSLAGLLGVLLPAPLVAAADASPEGFWRTRGFVIEISRCGSGYCGQLVGLNKSERPDGDRLDKKNKDPNHRDRPLCGIRLFWDFRATPQETGKWQGGSIYNPDDGNTYAAEARMQDPDTLKVRAYVMTPAFGKDVTLVREPDANPSCRAGSFAAGR